MQWDWPGLADEARVRWDANASFWDQHMGEANNSFHEKLIRPATEQLLELQPPVTVLDVACGNGNFSRRLAELGANVTAIDSSSEMIKRAQAHTDDDSIAFHVIDAADIDAMGTLGTATYDAVVCNMGIMDMAVITPFFKAVHRLVKPDGRFIFSVLHPCFQSAGRTKIAIEKNQEGQISKEYAVQISRYITPEPTEVIAIGGQPEPQYIFHRPLSVLLDVCIRNGFIMDGLLEPVFDGHFEGNNPFAWEQLPEIPPILVLRLRPYGPKPNA